MRMFLRVLKKADILAETFENIQLVVEMIGINNSFNLLFIYLSYRYFDGVNSIKKYLT